MRLSHYFAPLARETPADASIVSHRLMLRTGMIRQAASGIYVWLPLGLAVLRRIEAIVREEQNAAGAIEFLMPTLQPAGLWEESGRLDGYGKEMLRIRDRHGRELVYGPTNEEMITDVFRNSVKSYRNLPLNLYHIQWKFRDEIRPRFGVMRGREFLMKDAYSFDLTPGAAALSYCRMFVAYLRTFARMGLKVIPVRADSGPIGGNRSHEFLVLSETGESVVHCDSRLLERPVPPADIHDDPAALEQEFEAWTAGCAVADTEPDPEEFAGIPGPHRLSARGIEVGHVFSFGTRYSEPMGALVTTPSGEVVPVEMGSYGIGISRLAGAIIEASHDERGIIWPDSVAPFDVGIACLRPGEARLDALCSDLANGLERAGCTFLVDDLPRTAGAKFASLELLGLPWLVTIGPRGQAQGTVELKRRATPETLELSPEDAIRRILATRKGRQKAG